MGRTLASNEIPVISQDRHAEYAFLSPATGKLRITSGDPLHAGLTYRGVFARMDIGPVVLYRTDGEIVLQSERFALRLDPTMSASISRGPNNSAVLQITLGKALSLALAYTATPRWNSDLEASFDFTWTEEEHFDFGVRVANVINEGLNSFYAD